MEQNRGATERKGLTRVQGGISHFIEPLLFKGTRQRMACQIARPSERMGGQINSYYEGRVLRQNLDDALALNLDMLLFSKFTPGPWKWSATP